MLVVRNRLILAASLLALIVAAKLWFVEGIFRPVRIAGASMAETLRGAHRQLNCGDCGFPCRYDAERPPIEQRVVCSNCGYFNRDLYAAESHPGQRVLIDRLAYQLHPPRRWDLIAFRSDDDPDYLEVKRVVGLPSERISIRQGDVYVDGQLARKTLPQLRAAAVLVYDSSFEPRRTSGLPARWRAPADSGWTRMAEGFSYRSTSERGTAADWLTYHHWRCFASPLPRRDEYPVLDNYGYNQDESRQLHRVRDLMLVARLRLAGGSGRVAICGSDGKDWVRANLEFPARRASLYRRGHCVSSAVLPAAAYARDVKFEFAMCDRQILLAVDERVVISWPNESADQAVEPHRAVEQLDPALPAAPRKEADHGTMAQGQPFGIAADGLSVVIRRLQVFRDVYYLDPRGLARNWSAPAPLGGDEVLVLGDNVPVSRDSRQWQQPGVPGERILGPVLPIGN
jgi:signal peptidase I